LAEINPTSPIPLAQLHILAERLADSMVSRTFLPLLWSVYYERFLDVIRVEIEHNP
jgi:hypothetical protein